MKSCPVPSLGFAPTLVESPVMDLTGEMTVNAVIARHPETLEAFKRLGIDACCGGSLSLWEVSKRHHIEFVSLLSHLGST